jgi:hypothetical protein
VNVDVEHACMDERMEGHDDVNACVRTYNNNITTLIHLRLEIDQLFEVVFT